MRTTVFSIVTATYKRPFLLRRAVDSVLAQSFQDFEMIVVDDDPGGASAETLCSYKDDRIVTLEHRDRQGLAAAFNTGIRAARGAFITFLCDDDEYLPSFLEKTYAFFESPAARKCGFVWTGIRRVKDTPDGEVPWYEKNWSSPFATREAAIIEATSIGSGFGLTVRRRCFDDIGLFDPMFEMGQDTELLFRLVSRFDFAVVPEILVKIHHHQGSQLTDRTNYPIRVALYEKIIDRHAAFLNNYPQLLYVHLMAIVRLSYLAGMKRKGRQIMMRILRCNPCRVVAYLDWCCYELFGENARLCAQRSRIRTMLMPFLRLRRNRDQRHLK